jgi:hypothetical protein
MAARRVFQWMAAYGVNVRYSLRISAELDEIGLWQGLEEWA